MREKKIPKDNGDYINNKRRSFDPDGGGDQKVTKSNM